MTQAVPGWTLRIAPNNASYSRGASGYVRESVFIPRLTTPDAACHLARLRQMGEGIVVPGIAGMGQISPFDIVPGVACRIDPFVLRGILDAIRGRQEIEITYQSMSQPQPGRRWIAPHALAFDGFRWYARARCALDGTFKDFVLARISAPGKVRPAVTDPLTDDAWHRRVRAIIGPHPGLSEGQRKAVEADYGMTNGVSAIDVRASFLWYFLKRFGIEGDTVAKPPQDQHIILLNRHDVIAALSERQEA